MSKAFESGKAFVDQILAKLPEGLRDSAKTALTAPEATDALTYLGDGVLARADYSRQKDQLDTLQNQIQADYDRLTNWWEDHKDYDTIKAEHAALKAGTPVVPVGTPEPVKVVGLTQADVDKQLQERDMAALRYANYTNQLAIDHYAKFNEALDLNALSEFALKNRVPIDAAYRQQYAEKLDARSKAEEAVRIQKLVDDGMAAERQKYNTQPFPLRNQAPSVLDILDSSTDKPANHNLDSAVAEYERLSAARG